MPSWENRRIGKRRSHSNVSAEMGLLSRHADREGQGAQNQRGRGKRDWTGRGARASQLEELTATEVDTTIPRQVELKGEC